AATPPRFAALLRGGTAGDLAKSVPSPSRPEQVPAWLATDRWRRLDAGRLATSTGRRYFINVADAGIGAEVVRRAARGPAWVGGHGGRGARAGNPEPADAVPGQARPAQAGGVRPGATGGDRQR